MAGGLNILVRWALYLDLMLLLGLPAFLLYAPAATRAPLNRAIALRPLLVLLAFTGIALSVLGLAVTAAAMADVPLTSLDRPTVTMILTQTPLGTAWQVRLAALVLAALGALLLPAGRALAAAATLPGAIALGTLAWGGHGAAGEGTAGTVQLWADICHLIGAGIWIGALAAFGLLLFRPHRSDSTGHIEASARSLDRFASVGALSVALLIATGLVNGFMLVGWSGLPRLPATLYGQLLIAKLVIFAGMLGLAATNRFRLTPALTVAVATGDTVRATAALRRSLAVETAAALTILAVVALLGTLAPPASS